MSNFQYSYLLGDIFLGIIWSFIFILRKGIRKKMIVVSLFSLPFAFYQFLYVRDYWRPQYFVSFNDLSIGIEDLLFCFFVGGYSAVVYQFIFKKMYKKETTNKHLQLLIVLLIITAIFLIILNLVFGVNSMLATVINLIILCILIYSLRPDLIRASLTNGLLFAGSMFISYLVFFLIYPDIIRQWWLLKNLSGVMLLNIPIEELLWGLTWGMFVNTVYEFSTGLKYSENK